MAKLFKRPVQKSLQKIQTRIHTLKTLLLEPIKAYSMKYINHSFALIFILSSSFAYPMQMAEYHNFATALKNSAATKWLNRYKTPLLIGSGLVAAYVAYSYLRTPTPQEIKERIKRNTESAIKTAQNLYDNVPMEGRHYIQYSTFLWLYNLIFII